jgi:antirestriction protein ArdC
LIAGIGAAFLSTALSITLDPHPDHAAYHAGWHTVLKSDQKAIFTAAAMAKKATDWLGAKSHPDLGKCSTFRIIAIATPGL